MRRLTVIMILLTVLLSFSSVLAVRNMAESRNQVVFTLKEQSGDPSVLDGLNMSFDHWSGMRNLCWKTDMSFSSESFSYETDVKYFELPYYNSKYPSEDEAYLGINNREYYEIQELWDVRDEFLRMKLPGKPDARTIRLKDYLDYYPLNVWTTFYSDGKLITSSSVYSEMVSYDSGTENGPQYYMEKAFNDFFRIPVLEDDYVVMRSEGRTDVEYESDINSDTFYCDSRCTCSDHYIYFYINNRTSSGQFIDTSLIPGGYGIYRIPYGYVTQDNYKGTSHYEGMDVMEEQLIMYFSLPQDHVLLTMHYEKDAGALILNTIEEGHAIMRVIDGESGLLRQQLDFGAVTLDPDITRENDCLIVSIPDDRIMVLQLNDEGTYEEKVCVDNRDITALKQENRNYDIRYIYDGDHLTVMITDEYRSGFHLFIYDTDSQLYSGHYESNLRYAGEIDLTSVSCHWEK